MTVIGSAQCAVELHDDGTWSVVWPALGAGGGPFGARVETAEGEPGTAAGRWLLDAETRVHWSPDGDGLSTALAVDGAAVTVDVSYRAPARIDFDRFVVVEGPLRAGAQPFTARLIEGYDGCCYAGVRAASVPGQSFWRAAFARPDGVGVGVAALTARRFCSVVHSAPRGADALHLVVACGATPEMHAAPDTIGYLAREPGPLRLPLEAGEELRAEPVVLCAGPDAASLVDGLAERAGRTGGARRWDGPPITGWESWYHYGLLDVSAEVVLANARVLRDRYGHRPDFDLVQVDDGWQRTYGDWQPNERFPADLGDLVEDLHALGCRAGLWVAPFMVQPGAPGLGVEHPEWMIRGSDGVPVVERNGRWGIDASHPDARDWLLDLGARVRAWGFEMVKADFCYLGAQEGGRHDPRVTGIEAHNLGLDAFLAGLGGIDGGVYVLTCIGPLLAHVGRAHGHRTGIDLATPVHLRDVGAMQPLPDWTGWRGILPQARNAVARGSLHRRWFNCDPDVVMAWGSDGRDPHGYATEEARTLAALVALVGGPFFLADDLAALAPTERAVLEHAGLLDLAVGEGFRPLDPFGYLDDPDIEHAYAQPDDLPSVWFAERRGRRVAALFNWSDAAAMPAVPDGFRGLTELWTGEIAGADLEVPAHGVRVLVTSPTLAGDSSQGVG